MQEYVKVTEFVRGVVDGVVVVRRPGARIPVALAIKLGIHDGPDPAQVAAGGRKRPRKPAGATPPARRSTGRR